jgi:Zn-dependent protease
VTESTLLLIFSLLAFLFTISIHESAHALVADRCGDPTARLLGRISLNPLRHMELWGTVLIPLLTAVSGLPMIGWAKPTPVDTSRLRQRRRDSILVSAAGPASNLLTALVCLALLLALRASSDEGTRVVEQLALVGSAGLQGSVLHPLATLVYRLLTISVILGMFNLLPVPPLDGSHIVGELLPGRVLSLYRAAAPFGLLIILALFWYTPVDQWLFDHPMRWCNSLLRM